MMLMQQLENSHDVRAATGKSHAIRPRIVSSANMTWREWQDGGTVVQFIGFCHRLCGTRSAQHSSNFGFCCWGRLMHRDYVRLINGDLYWTV